MKGKREIVTDKAPEAIGPYSQGIRINNLIFTSGQLPISLEGEISGDIVEQTRQSLKNIEAILKQAGSGMENIIKCTVFISDMNDFPQVNKVYQEFFQKPYPARTCVEVSRLPKDVRVEIEAVAYAEDGEMN